MKVVVFNEKPDQYYAAIQKWLNEHPSAKVVTCAQAFHHYGNIFVTVFYTD